MSRLYFQSPSGKAELLGSEHHWLGHVAKAIAMAAWNIDRDTDRGYELVALIPEEHPYLHKYMREAQAEERCNKELYQAQPSGYPRGATYNAVQRFRSALSTALNVEDLCIEVAGHRLHSFDIGFNTALACGSPSVQLAAKLYGWGEGHCFFEGEDRAWAADVIDEGLKYGVLRRAIWYVDGVCDGPIAWHPERKLSSQGWEGVQEFLRARDDEPVVLWYSVADEFPNRGIAGWEPSPMPEGWHPDWADNEGGMVEWERDYPEADDRLECYTEHAGELWDEIPEQERWDRAMEGLRRTRPWARISLESLGDVFFGPPVTIYDLFAPDRDERVRAAVSDE